MARSVTAIALDSGRLLYRSKQAVEEHAALASVGHAKALQLRLPSAAFLIVMHVAYDATLVKYTLRSSKLGWTVGARQKDASQDSLNSRGFGIALQFDGNKPHASFVYTALLEHFQISIVSSLPKEQAGKKDPAIRR